MGFKKIDNFIYLYFFVQFRNVLEAVAGIKEMDESELSEIVYENTKNLFF